MKRYTFDAENNKFSNLYAPQCLCLPIKTELQSSFALTFCHNILSTIWEYCWPHPIEELQAYLGQERYISLRCLQHLISVLHYSAATLTPQDFQPRWLFAMPNVLIALVDRRCAQLLTLMYVKFNLHAAPPSVNLEIQKAATHCCRTKSVQHIQNVLHHVFRAQFTT